MGKLRNEVLMREYKEGCIEMYDPLLQKSVQLSVSESQMFLAGEDSWDATFIDKLDHNFMLEGMGVDAVRNHVWEHRTMFRIQPDPTSFPPIDWNIAQDLPDSIQEGWKSPERWRRLYELSCSGTDIFVLDELIQEDILMSYASQLDSFEDYTSAVVNAKRQLLHDGMIVDLMHDEVFRSLCQSLLHVPLLQSTWVQAWKLEKGEGFGVHADGSKYVGTLSIGCCPHWKASNGGAITFGHGGPHNWKGVSRWLPHLGSALLFRPRADLWHGVEDVQSKQRISITGWWLEGQYKSHAH